MVSMLDKNVFYSVKIIDNIKERVESSQPIKEKVLDLVIVFSIASADTLQI